MAFGTLRRVVEFAVGLVVGASVAALAMIVIAPSRRVRAERPLPPEVEAAVLLGRRPEDSDEPPAPEHPRLYSEADIDALRRLGPDQPRRRRR